MSSNREASVYNVQVLDRVVAILDVLASGEGELSLPELSQHLGIHKSTVHRLLRVLERHRFVERSPVSGKYVLGLRLFELGTVAGARLGLAERAHRHLERLASETGETAHLCILEDGEVLYLQKVEGARTVRVPSTVGRRNPAHCTAVGKALIAWLPDDEVERIVALRGLAKRTPRTITKLPALRRELRAVRERGYAVDDGEIEEELVCIGAPVRDASGQVVASLSIAGPSFRLARRRRAELARHVVAAADALSVELGFASRGARTG